MYFVVHFAKLQGLGLGSCFVCDPCAIASALLHGRQVSLGPHEGLHSVNGRITRPYSDCF